jgi:hypothetical protein
VFLDASNVSSPFFTLQTEAPPNSIPAGNTGSNSTWFFCMQGVDGQGNGGTWYTAACSAANGKVSTTVSTTQASPSTTVQVTSASGVLVGQTITIAGAGTSGGLYTGTIKTISGTTLTLSAATKTAAVSGAAVTVTECMPVTGGAEVELAAAPSTSPAGTSTVTTQVDIPSSTPYTGRSVSLTGPLYTGLYVPTTHAFFVASVESPSTGTNSYSVFGVPNGTSGYLFAGVNQANDGLLAPQNPFASTAEVSYAGAGDIYNYGRSSTLVTISTATTQPVNLTAYTEQSIASVTTQSFATYTDQHGTPQPQSYAVNFSVQPYLALPGKVELQTPSTKLNSLLDFAASKDDFFTVSLGTGTIEPQVGDSYQLLATPLDTSLTPDQWGSPSSTCVSPCPLTVSGVNTSYPTSLTVSASEPASYGWAAPVSPPASYTYQVTVTDSNGNQIVQVSNIPSTTFTEAPGVTLTTGNMYTLSVSTVDGNGNVATQNAAFTAP